MLYPPKCVSLHGLSIHVFFVITIPMGEGFQRIISSTWRQPDIENDVILGLQAILGKEELRDDVSDVSVTNSDRVRMTVKDDRR